MVSSWNVAERDALLRFAPKYFAYLKRSAGVSIANVDFFWMRDLDTAGQAGKKKNMF